MRLDKFVSHCSGLSRKRVRALIHSGAVAVDQQVQCDTGLQITPTASITLEDRLLSLPGHRYLMLHKPAGYLCARSDGDHPTVLDLLPGAEKLQIVGRLDLDTTGLLLLTDDGQWNHRLTSPNSHCGKTYRVHTADPIAPNTIDTFARGVQLHGDKHPTRPAKLELLAEREALLTLSEGRHHQVKRMFAATGNRVTALHREAVGSLILDPNLAPGQHRALTPEEVAGVYS